MMSKKIIGLLILLTLMPVHSSANSVLVKKSAPEVYVVKKGDTLWDISNMYLDKPWLWPQLWRTNIYITNPHLIYPGDKLRLVKNERGELELEVIRESAKLDIKLSPEGTKLFKTPEPIAALPWSVIKPYIENEMIMSQQAYDRYPHVLGDQEGAVRYATDNLVLGTASRRSKEDLNIVRKQNELYDMDGNFIGLQIRHLATAKLVVADIGKQKLIRILQAKLEVKRGDKIIPAVKNEPDDILLIAAKDQTGFIIDDLEQHNLLGRYNVVVLNLGINQVSAGTIMGIYSQGPKIIDGKNPKYEGETDIVRSAFNEGNEIIQPAMKVGEVVVFKTYDTASYALITKSARVIKRGMIVARP
jgi:LysM repeat protein/co-chaperonin GroES (HSP10)